MKTVIYDAKKQINLSSITLSSEDFIEIIKNLDDKTFIGLALVRELGYDGVDEFLTVNHDGSLM